jgi:FKBP-type peptidyl-prolyl cis-trans isomerase 2
MQSEKIAVIALVVIIAGALSAYLLITYGADIFKSTPDVDDNAIAIGDCVDVNYIGRFADNQTIFDTSYESIALSAGIYDENRTYEPLQIFVNPNGNLTKPANYTNYSASMIKGFLDGLIGMKKGENKTVTIPPEEAYGIWNESLAEEYGLSPYPTESVVDIEWDFERTMFIQYFPDVNLSVNTTFDWGAIMVGINDTINATITKINETNVTYNLLPINGTSFTMPLFNWDVIISVTNDTAFSIKTTTELGFTTSIDLGYNALHIKVVGLNETDINLAINMEAPDIKFVGQTLEFTLNPIDVYKTSLAK